MANPLLTEPLRPEHVKPRLLGHWGTSPGLNLVHTHLNRVIKARDLNTLCIWGPGHGGPAVLANSWLEGSYTGTYPASTAPTCPRSPTGPGTAERPRWARTFGPEGRAAAPARPGRLSGTLKTQRESWISRDTPLEGMDIMAVHDHSHRQVGLHLSFLRRNGTASVSAATTSQAAAVTMTSAYVLAGLRVLTRFVFLWAFLDKTLGFGYSTGSGKGWIDGGSPTRGFLGGVAAGPMQSTFHSWAGAAWADWLFTLGLLGLLGIGLALIAGIGLWLAAVAGTAMMALMWIAEWPPAKYLSDGSASMSTNPFADYHLIYAVVLIALAAASADATRGLGRAWARLPFVSRNRWLL